MREIKFRAWDKENKKIISWWNICSYYNLLSMLDPVARDYGRYEVVQYTGLKDKNGTEIYEGDIVQDADKRLFEVKHGAYTRVDYIGMDKRIRSSGYGWYVQNLYTNQMVQGSEMIYTEVIGNIYKNPELLEIDNK